MTDPLDLERFVAAHEPLFERVLSELRAGRKRAHWMWFVCLRASCCSAFFISCVERPTHRSTVLRGLALVEESGVHCDAREGFLARLGVVPVHRL